MTASATDIAGNNSSSIVEVPHIESLEELDAHFEQTYGPEVMTALKDSNSDQAGVVEALHKAGLNGRSEAVERTYRLHQQEFARKESLLGTTWRWTKEAANTTANAVAWPFRKSWEFAKKHPVVTSLAVAAAVAGGLYLMWGVPIPIPNPIVAAGEVAAEGAQPVADAFEALEQGQIVGPNMTNPYVPQIDPSLPGAAVQGVEPPPFDPVDMWNNTP